MPKCGVCGTRFQVEDARNEHDADEFTGQIEYDEEYPEGDICASCAIDSTVENLGAGRGFQFSLETGRPPEDVPDDWIPED